MGNSGSGHVDDDQLSSTVINVQLSIGKSVARAMKIPFSSKSDRVAVIEEGVDIAIL